ncbi:MULTISPECIES: class I SAM-dependent methyltransferase [unclassified Bartonella]|uniref:class I SAM-dependent methyltransferase n=1 Tax=unclassified Bartonella TaxID=2645622 RepID=UPI0035D0D186
MNNTSPSGLETIRCWIPHGAISKNSYLLDLVCSTGFSALNIVCEVQCQAVGIDISAESVPSAQNKVDSSVMQTMVKFHVGNAERMTYPENTFTHITAG